jgi:NAD(P) transhydrogenase subunit beta
MQNVINLLLFGMRARAGCRARAVSDRRVGAGGLPGDHHAVAAVGVLLIIPIGGADMPDGHCDPQLVRGTVGRRDGLRARQQAADHGGRARRVVRLILAIIMCKAMNRSFTNVLFGAFGQVQAAKRAASKNQYKSETVEGAGRCSSRPAWW